MKSTVMHSVCSLSRTVLPYVQRGREGREGREERKEDLV